MVLDERISGGLVWFAMLAMESGVFNFGVSELRSDPSWVGADGWCKEADWVGRVGRCGGRGCAGTHAGAN